jgi:hypothetical protein
MKPHNLFQIEDFQKDDLTIQVQIEGKGAIDIRVKDYEKWLKDTDRLTLFDYTGTAWASMNHDAYWARSEFFICDDLYMFIVQDVKSYEQILKS